MALKKYNPNEVVDVKKIVVLMFGLLGDVLIRTPVLKALKSIYPEAEIIAVVDPIGKMVLKNSEYCKQIIMVDRNKCKKISYYYHKLSSMLKIRQIKSDMIVDLYNGGSSHGIVTFSNARYKLGYCESHKKNIYNIHCIEENIREKTDTYYDSAMSVVNILQNEEFSLKPSFSVTAEAESLMQDYIDSLDIDLSKAYLVNFGSGGLEKMLAFDKYFVLIEYIYKKYGFAPLIISNPGQEFLQNNFINEYMKRAQIPYIKLDTLSLDELAVLIKKTPFMITPDTGLMHLAMAYENYIYAIFTYTNPSLVDPQNSKFIALYDAFKEGELYKEQKITKEKMIEKIDILFARMNIATKELS